MEDRTVPAARQQHLAIHLHRRLPAELPAGQVGVVGGADEVVRQGLVHVLVQLQPVQEHRRVLVRHQVATEAVRRDADWGSRERGPGRTGSKVKGQDG